MTRPSPPDYAIRAAVEAARRSPCAKSKRGAAVFSASVVYSVGFNAQPTPLTCTADERCRAACGRLCEHAEQVAIRLALSKWSAQGHVTAHRLPGCSLVHAKVVNGLLVPGGGPSCWQCSRLVLAVGLDGAWLYEGPDGRKPEHYRCTACSQIMTRDIDFEEYQHSGCGGLVDRVGEWRFYIAEAFHRATLAACEIVAP